jgi:glycosyltransferase involved in cell wall biosynthesis
LTQSYEDFELILVDHGSIDKTRSIMRAFEPEDERVRVVVRPRSEPFTSMLNQGWRSCAGDLIARMDADDIAHRDRLQLQVELLASHPDLDACGTLVRIRRRLFGDPRQQSAADSGYARYEAWINSVVTPERIAAERFVDSPLANPSTMVRRSAFERLGGYEDVPWAEDYDFWLRMLESGARLGKVVQVLLDWFDSDQRATRRLERYSQDRFQRAKAHYLARLPVVRERGVAICGAGPIGKRLAQRLVRDHKIVAAAFFEVSEKRIGNLIGGIPVLSSEYIADYRHRVLIAAVGQPGARKRIRGLASEATFTEGVDFFCIA